MKGWFDAFRDNGGPTLYSFSNRTPVTGDVSIVAVCVLFATLYIAFLVIFPGVRKQRFTTFVTVTLSLFVGLVILVTRLGSSWHVASTHIVAPYKSFSREKIPAKIGAHIGLMHVNITLVALPIGNWSYTDIDYNEQFIWDDAQDMGNSYRNALIKGLPYPILTVAEYFSLGQEGFAWGGQYRAAGYYASILLWATLASWVLMNLLLIAVPRYGAYTKVLTGLLLILTNAGYYMLLPKRPLTIYIEGGQLEFRLGWCYWLVLVAGILCLFVGLVITAIDLVWPHMFSTILEVYYDTPYDRHVILEESHDVRYRKRNSKGLEEPPGLGSRILRRLSSKTKEQQQQSMAMAGPSSSSATSATTATPSSRAIGVDNRGFQNDAPNSPWRYPFRRVQPVQHHHQTTQHHHHHHPPMGLQRTLSQDSQTSSIASVVALPPHMQKAALSRYLPKPPLERTREQSNW